MLIKKLLKTLLFTSLITSTVAQANHPNIGLVSNPSTYHTNVDHLHNDVHNYWYRTPNVVICETSNVTKDYVLDADSTTLAEVADVLGTLIEDLKGKGVIS